MKTRMRSFPKSYCTGSPHLFFHSDHNVEVGDCSGSFVGGIACIWYVQRLGQNLKYQ